MRWYSVILAAAAATLVASEELYFGGLVEALEEHMANGDLVFPDGK